LALTSEVKAGLVTAAATLAVGLVTLNRALVGVFYDDGMYAGLAWALASGHGYVHPNLPGMPGAVHYPPLYPVVLAPLFGLLSVSSAAIAAKILNALLAATSVGLIVWHALRRALLGPGMPRWLVPVIAAAAALAIPQLAMQSVLFAEPLFGVLLAVSIILIDRADSPWIAGAVAALAFLTRSIGVAIVAGALCLLLARGAPFRVWRGLLLPPLVAALGWGIWVATHATGIDPALQLVYGTYAAPLTQSGLSALPGNIRDLPRPLEALAFGWVPLRWLYVMLGTASLGVGLYGLAILSRRSAVGLSMIFYVLILAVWPYPPDRFLWVLLPWLALTWAIGGIELWRRWPRLRVPIAMLAALGSAGYLHYEFQGFRRRWWDVQARAISDNFTELLPVTQNLPDSAVVATDNEGLVWLYTRRRSVPLYLERYRGRELIRPTSAEYRAYLERMGVTHVLLASATSPTAIELRGLLHDDPSWLTAVYRWSHGRWLFAVNRGQ
jgi:hypothetical protein